MDKLFLLPEEQMQANGTALSDLPKAEENFEHFLGGRQHGFFANGKQGIHFLVNTFNLQRDDELWITTTSDTSFVSSCVTLSVFNYCKVSRVLTDQTKMIWVIHEFGFAHPLIEELVKIAKERGIPLVEDVAHSMTSFHRGKQLGTYGDFALYSFPKTFPIAWGGLVTGPEIDCTNPKFDAETHSKASEAFFGFYPYLKALSERRRANYRTLEKLLPGVKQIYQMTDEITPFVFGFYSENYRAIYKALDNPNGPVQMGRTHVPNQVLLPVNSFLTEKQLEDLAMTVEMFV